MGDACRCVSRVMCVYIMCVCVWMCARGVDVDVCIGLGACMVFI